MLYFWKKDKPLNKLSLLFICLLISIGFILSCEKDDICAEGTPTTPQLIIRFYDLSSQDDTKTVSGLFAYALDDQDNIISIDGLSQSTRDSIAIPLRTGMNATRFVLHRDYDAAEPLEGNPEEITVTYDREDVYVSRACGFKTIFNNITFNVAPDGDNWILNSEIINVNVENENQAHVKVFH